MLFKIDENLSPEVAKLLREQGHDAATLEEQAMAGESDDVIARVVKREKRTLITLDLDFADIRAYPPKEYPGIIILRLRDENKFSVEKALRRILPVLVEEQVAGCLWIVEETKLRIREC